VNVDGSDLHSWSSEGSDYGPVFSPDIKIIIFARSGYYGDLRVSADGTTVVFLKWHSDWRGTPNKSKLYLPDLQSRKLTGIKVNGLDRPNRGNSGVHSVARLASPFPRSRDTIT